MSQSVAAPLSRKYDRLAVRQSIGFIVLASGITLAVLALCTIQYGYITGEEFSPDDFSRREFSYYEIPFVGLQVTPIDRKNETHDLESYLISQKLVAEIKTTDAQKRWDLVAASRGVNPATRIVFSEGQARILCSYLDTNNTDKKSVWLEWSKTHQELAKILWPAVAKLARQELYVFVPDLLTVARGAIDMAELQKRLDSLLAGKYLDLAQTQQKLGRHELAVELFTEAIAHAPQRATAFTGRASSLTSLGEQDRASADLAQAQSIDTRSR